MASRASSRTNTSPSRASSPTRRLRSLTDRRLQQVAEAAQGADFQPERAEAPPQAMHTDLDGGVGRWIAAAAQAIGDRLLAHDTSEPGRQSLQQGHFTGRQIDARAAE